MTDLLVIADATVPHQGVLLAGARRFPCAIGKAGVAENKREGDHASPAGIYRLRRLYYRPDRFATAPRTGLPARAIRLDDGWCDDAADAAYNRPVTLPFAASHEKLWRDDGLYDLVVEIGYNDAPPVPGRGSAIFLHIARPGYAGTEGCVALARADLLTVLEMINSDSRIEIRAAE